MSFDSFQDDPAWVRFRCLELAKDITKSRNAEKVIEAAKVLNGYVAPTPKCKIVKLRKRK